MNPARHERLLELLTDRALVGLGAREQIELAELLLECPEFDPSSFDSAAAAIALAGLGAVEPLPARLAAQIEADAAGALAKGGRPAMTQHLSETMAMPDRPRPRSAAPPAVTLASHDDAIRSLPNVVPLAAPAAAARVKTPSRGFAVAGWIAAAACLLLAVGALVYKTRPVVVTVAPAASAPAAPLGAPPALSAPALAEETATALRARLAALPTTRRAEWTPTKDLAAKGASGDVVWNADEQRGVMRFRGLAKNEAKSLQYQLWIFDKSRDEKYPVDGGVFDIDDETGDVVVPIRAKLPVTAPTLFAVTVEKPGGVVVSKRERIVVTAKLPTG